MDNGFLTTEHKRVPPKESAQWLGIFDLLWGKDDDEEARYESFKLISELTKYCVVGDTDDMMNDLVPAYEEGLQEALDWIAWRKGVTE